MSIEERRIFRITLVKFDAQICKLAESRINTVKRNTKYAELQQTPRDILKEIEKLQNRIYDLHREYWESLKQCANDNNNDKNKERPFE